MQTSSSGDGLDGTRNMFDDVMSRFHYIAAGENAAAARSAGSAAIPELLNGLQEHLRWLSQLVADWGATTDHEAVPNAGYWNADRAAQNWLPFNRKERYFTGTVLPMIVASDGFAHLARFLRMCGIDTDVHVDYLGEQQLQFFTEYSFRESLFTEPDRERFPNPPSTKDTPDLVLAGPGWLLAVEAKLYQRPNKASLEKQLGVQSELVHYLARCLESRGTPIQRVRHVALVPKSHLAVLNKDSSLRHVDATITWEEIAEAYRDVAPRFWLGQLEYANAHDLTAKPNQNWDSFRTGQEIAEETGLTHPTGEPYLFMGCSGGLRGKPMKKLLETGRWETHPFQVRREPYPHSNWFPMSQFREVLAR